MSRIDHVSYRETKTFGQYQNVTVEMSAEVSPADDPESVIDALKANVQRRLGERADQQWAETEASHDVMNARYKLKDIEDDIERAKSKWEKAKAFLASHGVEITEEMPF